MSELDLKEVETQRLSLKPGEVLVVKIRSDHVDEPSLHALRKGFADIFPDNKVVILAVEANGSIDLTIVEDSEYP